MWFKPQRYIWITVKEKATWQFLFDCRMYSIIKKDKVNAEEHFSECWKNWLGIQQKLNENVRVTIKILHFSTLWWLVQSEIWLWLQETRNLNFQRYCLARMLSYFAFRILLNIYISMSCNEMLRWTDWIPKSLFFLDLFLIEYKLIWGFFFPSCNQKATGIQWPDVMCVPQGWPFWDAFKILPMIQMIDMSWGLVGEVDKVGDDDERGLFPNKHWMLGCMPLTQALMVQRREEQKAKVIRGYITSSRSA